MIIDGIPALTSVDAALSELRDAIRGALRAEQLRDRLTSLPNDESLIEWIQERVEGSDFGYWIAFIEVDRFKNINDTYGYTQADELLKRIASRLQSAARDYFSAQTMPFRAHGDEFFIGGPIQGLTGAEIHERLDLLRREIAGLRLDVIGKTPMSCTVSIGYLLLEDSLSGAGISTRKIRSDLEVAVASAKVERNRVVRFSKEMGKKVTAEGRADCARCSAKFVVTAPVGNLETSPYLTCPNCASPVDRPPSLQRAAEAPTPAA